MPCERKHVEAILALAKEAMPSHLCESPCVDCEQDSRLINAIHAALAACDELSSGAETGKETTCNCTEQQRWRSMESAPKDEEPVYLAYVDDDGEPCCGVGHRKCGSQWMVRFGRQGCNTVVDTWVVPTHWAPLPAAPEVPGRVTDNAASDGGEGERP